MLQFCLISTFPASSILFVQRRLGRLALLAKCQTMMLALSPMTDFKRLPLIVETKLSNVAFFFLFEWAEACACRLSGYRLVGVPCETMKGVVWLTSSCFGSRRCTGCGVAVGRGRVFDGRERDYRRARTQTNTLSNLIGLQDVFGRFPWEFSEWHLKNMGCSKNVKLWNRSSISGVLKTENLWIRNYSGVALLLSKLISVVKLKRKVNFAFKWTSLYDFEV